MTDKRKLSLNSVSDLSGDCGMAMVNFDNLVHCWYDKNLYICIAKKNN